MTDHYLDKILRARVYDVAQETPLEVAPRLSRRLGNRVLLKREDEKQVTEQEFRIRADEALDHSERALVPLSDAQGFEVERQNGILRIVFEEPAPSTFVVSPNAPVRQIWVSAMARSYKLPWEPESRAFALNGETLPQLLDRLAKTLLGQPHT